MKAKTRDGKLIAVLSKKVVNHLREARGAVDFIRRNSDALGDKAQEVLQGLDDLLGAFGDETGEELATATQGGVKPRQPQNT